MCMSRLYLFFIDGHGRWWKLSRVTLFHSLETYWWYGRVLFAFSHLSHHGYTCECCDILSVSIFYCGFIYIVFIDFNVSNTQACMLVISYLPSKTTLFLFSGQHYVPFGCALLDLNDTVVSCETCEELFTPQSPHILLVRMCIIPCEYESNCVLFLKNMSRRLNSNKFIFCVSIFVY